MNSRSIHRLLTVTLAAILAGCGSDSGFDEDTDFLVGEGAVQFVNMMPDSMTVTMQHGIQNSQVRFPFAEPVENRFEDNYNWRVVYTNNSNDVVTIIERDDQPITEDVLSTFLLMGTVDSPSVQIFDTPIVSQDDRQEGFADVWFASNVTHADMVDVYLTENDTDIATIAPTATITTGNFTNLISVPSGEDMQLRVTVAGTTEMLFDSGPIPILDRTQELFAVVDDFGPDSEEHVNVIRSLSVSRSIMRDASQRGQTRIANYSSVTALDTTYDSAENNDIAANTRTGYFDSGEGESDYLASNDGATLEETTFTGRLGTFFTIYNFDNTSTDATTVTRSLIVEDQRRSVRKRALLKFINGNGTTIDLFTLRGDQTVNNTPPFINDAGFSASVTAQFLTANLTFIVRSSSENEELARLSQSLTEGATYTLLFTPDQQLVLLED